MVTLLTIIGIILAIPVGIMVAWGLIKFLWAILSDIAGLIVALIIVGVISLIVMTIL